MLESNIADFVVVVTGDLETGVNVYDGMVMNHGTDLDTGEAFESIVFEVGIGIYRGDDLCGVRHLKQIYQFDNGEVEEHIFWEETTEQLLEMSGPFALVASGIKDEVQLKEIIEKQIRINDEDNAFNDMLSNF